MRDVHGNFGVKLTHYLAVRKIQVAVTPNANQCTAATVI